MEREHLDLRGAVRPLTKLGGGYTSLAVETAGGVVLRVPKREGAATYDVEARLLDLVGPSLPVAVPKHEWTGAKSTVFPWGYTGYRKVLGSPLDAGKLDASATKRLAGQLAEFFAALHAAPLALAMATGIANDWRGHYEALRDATMPELARVLRPNEHERAEAWWRKFFADDALWTFERTLVHGDIAPEHILVSSACDFVGVIDFGDACIGDPAVDLAGLLAYVGDTLAEAALAEYAKLRGDDGDSLMRRTRVLAAAVPFFAVYGAVSFDDPEVPTLEEALVELRASAILR